MLRRGAGRLAAIVFLLQAGTTEPAWMTWHAWHHLEASHHDQAAIPAADEAPGQSSGPILGERPGGEDHPHLVFPSLMRPEFKASPTLVALPPKSMGWSPAPAVLSAQELAGITARGSPALPRTPLPRAPPPR